MELSGTDTAGAVAEMNNADGTLKPVAVCEGYIRRAELLEDGVKVIVASGAEAVEASGGEPGESWRCDQCTTSSVLSE